MMRWLNEHRIPLLFVAILLFIQSFRLDLNSPWKRPIAGDAQGYYAYLPALFIYQDLQYGFVPAIQEKYYVPATAKSFVKTTPDGARVNKTFPGVALLYLPFFLAAHGISHAFGLPADGYAYTYQLWFLIGFWFYFFAGLVYFRKTLLLLEFKRWQTDLVLALLVFGTNLFFYSVYDQSVTHCYNFFLANLAVYHTLKLKASFTPKSLLLILTSLSLLVISRPTNILVLGMLLFFVPELQFRRQLFIHFKRLKNILKFLLLPAIILFIPLILWKLQTGSWLVYSYGEEGFDFRHPEWYNFLFSYTKGWLLYTPLMLLILVPGGYLLFKQSRPRFWIGLFLLTIAIYVFSSWWCWYYGAGMSQRVMIDFYLIPGFLLALILRDLGNTARTVFLSFALLLTGLNMAQAYQIARGILPFGSPTPEAYWDNFLVFKKRARVYPQKHWDLKASGTCSFDPNDKHIIKGSPDLIENTWLLTTEKDYSAVARVAPPEFSAGDKLIFTFEARADLPVTESRVVFAFGDGSSRVFMLNEYISSNWEIMEYLIEIPQPSATYLDVFLWNAGSGEHVYLRNLKWKLYHSDSYF